MGFYDDNWEEYIKNTYNNDMSEHYMVFEKFLSKNSCLLDVGFGSGRDSIYFQNNGYVVYSIDIVDSFLEHGRKIGLKNVFKQSILEMKYNEMFDGIWASASFLHFDSENLKKILVMCYNALKKHGILYASFKYGDKEYFKDNRYYIDMNELKLSSIIQNTKFDILTIYKSSDK